MSLTPGTRIGAYEVRAALGAGGMGEVYRACDVKGARSRSSCCPVRLPLIQPGSRDSNVRHRSGRITEQIGLAA